MLSMKPNRLNRGRSEAGDVQGMVAQEGKSQNATMNMIRTPQIEAYQHSEFVLGHKYRFLLALLCPYYKYKYKYKQKQK